ncbi:MAG: U32 family peptidase [Clostridia bacterium]|nr:U32 family peptidase [Clostridia bacterium]
MKTGASRAYRLIHFMAELLSPAGSFEKLRAAVLYGADAVYLAGNMFGMRAAAANFSDEELAEAVTFAHARGKKLYLTLNTMPREHEYPALEAYLDRIGHLGLDAFIIADPGVLALVKEKLPDMECHISTQTSTVSSAAAKAWHALGAKRVVLARELSMAEIMRIRDNIPAELELEAFIHGSMCVSYSGRCLLSNFFTGRDGNRGQCAQPCRWNYVITEEKRPEMPLPIEETERGTFIMSSKDMCMIEHIPELMNSGIDSFKIEGRMKSAYYTAVVTNAYRMAMDAYVKDPAHYTYDPAWLRELESVSHREYGTGYYYDNPMENAQTVENPGYLREKAYLAVVTGYDPETGIASFIQRNKVSSGTDAELISPGCVGRSLPIHDLKNAAGEDMPAAPHPSMKFTMPVPFAVREGDILRA